MLEVIDGCAGRDVKDRLLRGGIKCGEELSKRREFMSGWSQGIAHLKTIEVVSTALGLKRHHSLPGWGSPITAASSFNLNHNFDWVPQSDAYYLINSFTDTGTEESCPSLLGQSLENLL